MLMPLGAFSLILSVAGIVIRDLCINQPKPHQTSKIETI
ncbi:MAG: hypothetical protein Rsou_1687 [Candidatus Ruthia sp. Asou_11_S2]|nr:hypothetical protein [Candidatus Ruthia sp. Asou_11_S2]